MNIYKTAPEFVEWDNRKNRVISQITAESLYNRFSIQLPSWFVGGKTVLDLGCCLGAAGHMSLTNGAKHYTGVDIQQKYVTDSTAIMLKYWPQDKVNIICQDLEMFLDDCIAKNIKFDVVIATGVLYAFFNLFNILEKFSAVSNESILIDTSFVSAPGKGVILFREDANINYAHGNKTFVGLGSSCNLIALDLMMKTNGFYRSEDPIVPNKTLNSHDSYSDLIEQVPGKIGPARFAVRYNRQDVKFKTLLDKIVTEDMTAVTDFYQIPNVVRAAKDNIWTFDDIVADRFQHEAITNIPDYERVIDLCLEFSKQYVKPDDSIIDIGSALGYTVDRYIQNGFNNIVGLDSSKAMVSKSLHQDKIILGDTVPDQFFKLILINWTLHFIVDKYLYLQDLYNKLEPNGYLIISDKTTQTSEIKKMYYDFKLSNGVTQEYIDEKEKKLLGYMHPMPASWYTAHLEKIGFTSIEIINSKLGFVTFLCKK